MKRHFVTLAVLTAGIVLLATSISEAQRRQPGGRQRGQRGGFGRGSVFGNLPTNKYLQGELKLTSAQKKRMREITIQLRGASALLQDDIAQELGLSTSQKEKIRKVQDDASGKRREMFRKLFGGGGERPSREEITKKFREMQESTGKEMLGALTQSQKSKFEKMKGKAVDKEKAQERPDRGRRRTRPDV